MNNSSRIFWFSGTGNSLYAAKQLSAELGDIPLDQMTDAPIDKVGGDSAKIGFVFPSYYGNLPRAVHSFIERLEIAPDSYIFAVITMGGAGQGSVSALRKALKAKGLKLNYGRALTMPANYIIKYNPATPEKGAATDKTDTQLRKVAAEVSSGAQRVRSLPLTMGHLYKNIESLDAAFTVSDSCINCGLCERICPVENIRMENGKPEWLHHCEHCVACISWCPTRAIDYGKHTQSRNRYHNPNIKPGELSRPK